jgi:hypothetical protein
MKTIILIVVVSVSLIFSCQKKYDLPPAQAVPEGAALSIKQLKTRLTNSNSLYRFSTGDSSVYFTVTMDETSGNIYKQVFVCDDAGDAMVLKLLSSGGLYQGDRIRVNLNAVWLVCANNQVSLDSIDLEKSVVKISTGTRKLPKSISMLDLQSNLSFRDGGNLQSQLVQISTVEFNAADRGKSLANYIGKSSLEYEFGTCYGFKIGLRTSGLARFASKNIPQGAGSIIGVLQEYNNAYTLVLRDYSEMTMSETPCGPPDTTATKNYLFKNFEDQSITSGDWQLQNVVGVTTWSISNFGQSSYYARIYNKTNTVYEACEAWMISPEINLSPATDPILNFKTANSSTASPLALMVSEDYVQGAPSTGTWKELPFTIQKSSFTYCASGDVSLQAYKGKKIRLAWKYSGTAASGSIWNVDEILVKEK